MSTFPRHLSRLALLAAVVVLAIGAGSARAASVKAGKTAPPCWKVLINDWYDNGRIDGVYPIPCYRDALKHLPADLREYSSIVQAVDQALEQRLLQSSGGSTKRHTDGGGTTTTTPGNGKGNGGTGGGTGYGGGSGKGPSGSGSTKGSSKATGPFTYPFSVTKPASADSVPVPLIVLGAVALLLMAAGAAGFVARRMRTRRLQLASAASLPQAGREPPRRSG